MPFPRFFLVFLLLHPCSLLLANDGAAEIALGGIRLKQERRVSMVKERLYISKRRVRVDYEFRNESKEDVVTEIAFPIPEYQWGILGWQPFDDFKVWVDDQPKPFQTEARAFVKGKEITTALQSQGITIATLGDFEEGTGNPKPDGMPSGKGSTSQMERLTPESLGRLVALGAVDGETSDYRFRHLPLWSVRKTYHWTQTFPAGATVRISHEYTPATGEITNTTMEDLSNPEEGLYNSHAEALCPDASLIKAIKASLAKRGTPEPESGRIANCFGASWVRYILTTANTWKTPIQDFELIVDRDPGELVTFCWEGPVEKAGTNTFRARLKDFRPGKELTVYFIQP